MTIELLFDVSKSLFAKEHNSPAVLMLRAGKVAPTQSLVTPPKVLSKHRDLGRECKSNCVLDHDDDSKGDTNTLVDPE